MDSPLFNLSNLFKKKFIYPKSTKPNYTGYKALMADEIALLHESLKQHTPPPLPQSLIQHLYKICDNILLNSMLYVKFHLKISQLII